MFEALTIDLMSALVMRWSWLWWEKIKNVELKKETTTHWFLYGSKLRKFLFWDSPMFKDGLSDLDWNIVQSLQKKCGWDATLRILKEHSGSHTPCRLSDSRKQRKGSWVAWNQEIFHPSVENPKILEIGIHTIQVLNGSIKADFSNEFSIFPFLIDIPNLLQICTPFLKS